MASVARTVSDLVHKQPFVYEALSRGLINYAAFAESIHDDVERAVGKDVRLPAIIMALRRLEGELSEHSSAITFDDNISIQVRDGLVEITIEKKDVYLVLLQELFSSVSFTKGDFLTMTQGVYELTIIADKKTAKLIESRVDSSDIISTIGRLSALTLRMPENYPSTPGYLYMITKEFTWQQINIQEFVSTLNELTLIVASSDVPRSFTLLQELLER